MSQNDNTNTTTETDPTLGGMIIAIERLIKLRSNALDYMSSLRERVRVLNTEKRCLLERVMQLESAQEINREHWAQAIAVDIHSAKLCADALGEPLPDPVGQEDVTNLVERVCARLAQSKNPDGKAPAPADPSHAIILEWSPETRAPAGSILASLCELQKELDEIPGITGDAAKGAKATTETPAELALDDIRLMVASALFEATAPTSDPNDVVRLVRRLVEAHAATKTTLWEAAKASAMALLADPERARTEPESLVREAAGLAAQGRCALDTLKCIDALSSGERKPTEADALAYEGSAKHAERDGRPLMAAAERAVVVVERVLMAYAERGEQAEKDRADHNLLVETHQEAGRELAVIVNEAHDQLDAAGVPRLPAPYDRSVAMRLKVFAAMRQRVIIGVDHGAGSDKAAWTVASSK